MKCETCDRNIAPHNGPVCDWCLAWPDCLTCDGSGEIVEYPKGEPTIVDCPTCQGAGTLDGRPTIDADGFLRA